MDSGSNFFYRTVMPLSATVATSSFLLDNHMLSCANKVKKCFLLRVDPILTTTICRVDDIEDNSKLRRGVPVAHSIYGVASTINTANYVYFQASGRGAPVFGRFLIFTHMAYVASVS